MTVLVLCCMLHASAQARHSSTSFREVEKSASLTEIALSWRPSVELVAAPGLGLTSAPSLTVSTPAGHAAGNSTICELPWFMDGQWTKARYV